MKFFVLTIGLLLIVFSSVDQGAAQNTAPTANTEQCISLLRNDLRSTKKQIVAANITLTDAEAIAFC